MQPLKVQEQELQELASLSDSPLKGKELFLHIYTFFHIVTVGVSGSEHHGFNLTKAPSVIINSHLLVQGV